MLYRPKWCRYGNLQRLTINRKNRGDAVLSFEKLGFSVKFDVLVLRKRGAKEASDQRILGDGDFVQDVISGLDELVKKNLRLSGQRPDINAISFLLIVGTSLAALVNLYFGKKMD